jgi:uncharacterized SAM-binding protein YcdF (DUF218 family)
VFEILLIASVSLAAWGIASDRRRVAYVAGLTLLLYCWLPLSLWATRRWEGEYQPVSVEDPRVGAMVVLSGSTGQPQPSLNEPLLNQDTYERCACAAQLHLLRPALPVLLSGGTVDPGKPPLSEAMRRELVRRGVPSQRIWLETTSRTTYENARYSAEILRSRNVTTIVLVTSATHMRRSAAAFRKQGLEVRTAPCAFRSAPLSLSALLMPSRTAIKWNDDLAHEIIGIVWYRLRSRL